LRGRLADLEAAPAGEAELADLREERDRLAEQVRRLEAASAVEPPTAAPDPEPVRRALAALDRARDELGDWLSEEPPHRPPDPPGSNQGRRRVPLPPAVFDDSIEAADLLVRAPDVVVLVDGYNVTKGAHPELALAEQRQWLLDAVGGLAARCDAELYLVFDGAGDVESAPAHGPRRSTVHVRYTAAGVEADDDVLGLVATVPIRRPVVVVSDDRRVREGAAGLGAHLVGSGTFTDLLRR
jgi:predicted RNA-binding protein with PIN domain